MSSFLTYKNASGRDFLITQNVRDSAVFFIPLPLNFWPLPPAPATFRSHDFCVHSFKHSNIVYNFGASGSRYLYAVYLNIFEWAFALFTFTFDFVITHTLCKGSTSYKIRYCQWTQDLLSSKYSSMVFSVISPDSRPVISQSVCWMQGCQVRVFSTELGYF